MLPYLEAFYQYGAEDGIEQTLITTNLGGGHSSSPRHVVQEGNWISEDDVFGRGGANSMASMHSSNYSVENIAQRKSRMSSQENGGFACINVMRKKGSLNTNFNSERNFADVSTRCSSLLRGKRRLEHLVETSAKFLSELKLVFREPFFLLLEPTEKPPLH